MKCLTFKLVPPQTLSLKWISTWTFSVSCLASFVKAIFLSWEGRAAGDWKLQGFFYWNLFLFKKEKRVAIFLLPKLVRLEEILRRHCNRENLSERCYFLEVEFFSKWNFLGFVQIYSGSFGRLIFSWAVACEWRTKKYDRFIDNLEFQAYCSWLFFAVAKDDKPSVLSS